MAGRNHLKRVQQAVDAVLAPQEPLAALEAARRLREAAEELEATKVQEVRATGVTWTKIGALYGMTKQGAQQRFGAEAAAARAAARRARKP